VKDVKEKLLFELRAAREAKRFYEAKVKKILKEISAVSDQPSAVSGQKSEKG